MKSVPFATRSYKNRSLPVSTQNLLNLFVEPQEPDSKNLVILHKRPGSVSFGTTGAGALRGKHVMAGVHYVVMGTELYSGVSSGTYTLRGTIIGDGLVDMADNGVQLVITTGTVTAYVYTVASGLSTITDSDFKAAYTVSYLGGYFCFDATGTGGWFISNLLDGTVIDSVDTATTFSHPDNVVAVRSNRKHLYVFGENSIEINAIVIDPDFPFLRINEATINKGCIARNSIANINDIYYWLGSDKEFYRFSGGSEEMISDPNISDTVNKINDVSDAEADVYEKGGHKFYIVSFRSGNKTLVYDTLTEAWCEWGSFLKGVDNVWDYRGISFVFGKRLIGDSRNGNIYELKDDAYSDNGETIHWKAVSPPIHNNNEWVRMPRFFLEFESGVGLTTGQGSDPHVILRHSDNGGRNWSNEQWRPIGEIGHYNEYGADWRRLGGRFKERTVEVSGTDPVPTVIIGAYMDVI